MPRCRWRAAALGIDLAIPEVSQEDTRWPSLACLQACPEGERIQPGVLSAVAGRFAYHAVERGVRLARPAASMAS